MKRPGQLSSTVRFFIGMLVLGAVPAAAQLPIPPMTPDCLHRVFQEGIMDVRCFQAAGDGVTDDTAAIQLAADWAAQAVLSGGLYVNVGQGNNTTNPDVYRGVGSIPVVHFPAGKYRLSDTINFAGPGGAGGGERVVKSDSNALIFQSNPNADIFHFPGGLNVEVEGLRLFGGQRQIFHDAVNRNAMSLTITNVEFHKALGFGLQVSKPDVGMQSNWISTYVTVDQCKFLGNRQAIYLNTDTTVISDTWWEWSDATAANGPQLIHDGGELHLHRIEGVPGIGQNTLDVRWIDMRGARISINDCRFGGELGGAPIIRFYESMLNTPIGYPYAHGTGIYIKNSALLMGPTGLGIKRGVIQLIDGVPQRIILTGNYAMIRESDPIIYVDPNFDLASKLSCLEGQAPSCGGSNAQLVYTFRDNQAWTPMDLSATNPTDSGLPEPIRVRANQ